MNLDQADQYRRPAPDREAQAAAASSSTTSRAGWRTSAVSARNEAAFHKHRLLPRYLVDVSKRDQSATVFGRTYSSPFGISPTGGVGLYRREGEVMLAEAAAAANIPYIMSGGSNASMEEALQGRAEQCLVPALCGQGRQHHRCADRAGAGLRRRRVGIDRRCAGASQARAQLPQRLFPNPRRRRHGIAEAEAVDPVGGDDPSRLGHRIYAARRRADPRELGAARPNGASTSDVIALGRSQTPASAQTWRDLERYRRLFPRPLIVKGILNPADAVRAAEIGVDGIIVSNHGGRQLDQAPASLEALPAIKAAVGDKVTVMLDSGVRRGADILIALCLGAQFVFFGRPTLYGAVAGGLPASKRRSTSSAARSTSSWARSAARASTSSAPISCGATTGRKTAERSVVPVNPRRHVPQPAPPLPVLARSFRHRSRRSCGRASPCR